MITQSGLQDKRKGNKGKELMPREYIEIPQMEVDGKLYYDRHLDMVEALIPNPYQYCHAADLLETADGDLLCCFFAGEKGEGWSDVNIYLSRLPADGSCWSNPVRVSDDDTRSEQNPSLFQHPDGDIWLIYTAHVSKTPGMELPPHANLQYTAQIRCKRSKDGGHTFGETETLFDYRGSFCRQKIQVLKSGRFVFGNWRCFDDDTRNGSDITVIQISDNQGKDWRAVEIPDSRGLVHCNLVERPDGRLVALFRSRGADYIYRAESEDEGEHWTKPEALELPNNNSSISAIPLQSGAIAMAYNSCGFGEDRNRSRWPKQRAPIALAISEDDGVTWDLRRIVESAEGYCGRLNGSNNRRYGYPVLMQGRDGAIHLAYTWRQRRAIKYVKIDEAWIRGETSLDEGLKYQF